MQTLGQQLRAEREKQGLSIQDLAERTRIRPQLFEAIEADNPEQFPGRFFYRSFLRQYAGLLGLPDTVVRPEIERSLADEQAEKAEREAAQQGFKPEVSPLPTGRINMREEARRWIIRLSGLLGVLILCSCVYFFWQRWGQRWFDEGWRATVTRPAQPAPAYAPPATQAAPPVAAARVPAPPVNPETTPLASGEPAAQPPAGQQPDVKVDSAPPGVQAHGRIEIRASGTCWIGGWRDGKLFLSSVLHAGDTRIVEGGGTLRLQFGNSGDVAITVDGVALRPIGVKGEPRTLEYVNGAYRLLNRGAASEAKP